MDLLEWIQQRAMKMMNGPVHLSCEESLRKLELSSVEKACVDFINIYK